jgi:8-oxo-dGTP pyrophosphatase MutT (NUDIX family)
MIDESFYHKPPGIKESLAAGGVVARLTGERVLIALVREGQLLDYILPKGSVEDGEDLQEAARREIEEEAGLNRLEFLAELGVQERLNYRRKAWKVIHYFLYLTHQESGQPTDSTHGYRCEWFPIDALPAMFWPEQKQLIEENAEWINTLVRQRAG